MQPPRFFVIILMITVCIQAQFSTRYWSNPRGNQYLCCTSALGCLNKPAFDCCMAPPGRANFDWVRATSAGPPGVLAFFETDASGDCLGCSSTGIINACYHNVPFETAMIIGASSACPNHAKKMTAGEVPDNSTSLCQTPHKFNTLTIGGYNYNISHLPLEELVDDLVADLPGHKLLQKWSLYQDKGVMARDVNVC